MDTALDLQDKRRAPRRLLTQSLRATEAVGGRLVGDVVNLSAHGLMLISKAPIAAGEQLSLLLDLPEAVDGSRRLRLDARCMWCAPSSFSRDYGAGFEITSLSEADRVRLQRLHGG